MVPFRTTTTVPYYTTRRYAYRAFEEETGGASASTPWGKFPKRPAARKEPEMKNSNEAYNKDSNRGPGISNEQTTPWGEFSNRGKDAKNIHGDIHGAPHSKSSNRGPGLSNEQTTPWGEFSNRGKDPKSIHSETEHATRNQDRGSSCRKEKRGDNRGKNEGGYN